MRTDGLASKLCAAINDVFLGGRPKIEVSEAAEYGVHKMGNCTSEL